MIDLNYLIDLFKFELFGQELWMFFLFFIFLYLAFPISKLVNYILNNYLKVWAAKTKFGFDDILFNSVNPSVTMFVFAGSFYVGSNFFYESFLKVVLGKIFSFLIIVPVVYFLIKFSTEAIGYYLKGSHAKTKVNEAAIDILMQIIRITLFFVGILLILANLGYDVSALLAGLGVGGLAFALAAQDLLKNFFAGISLIFDKTFGKGERVNFEGNSGKIEELRLRSTKLRTWDGTLLTIPNAMLADNIVENVTKVPKVKVRMNLGVVYGTSRKKMLEAKKIILNAVADNQDADEGNCDIWFDNFGAYSLDIKVIYYAKKLTMNNWAERIAMKEDVNLRVMEGFEKAGIEMAFPTQTIELKK